MLLTDIYKNSQLVRRLVELLQQGSSRIHVEGMTGTLPAVAGACVALQCPDRGQLFVAANKEEAYYLLNDLENLLDEGDADIEQKRVLLFPSSYRNHRNNKDDGGDLFETDNANVMQRSEEIGRASCRERV